jgi:hypothetical protein
VVDGKLFLFAAFFFKAEQKPFSGRIIILDLQIHDSADPGERVGKDPEQGAIPKAGVRGCLDRFKKLLNLAFNKCRRFAFGPRKSLGLDFPRRIHAEHSFFGQPREQHPDRRHVLFDRGRRGMALKRLDIRRDRDRFNVFEVLIPGALDPGQELLDCPVIGGSCVSVADRNRKEFEELFACRWAGARDECGS